MLIPATPKHSYCCQFGGFGGTGTSRAAGEGLAPKHAFAFGGGSKFETLESAVSLRFLYPDVLN